MRTLLSKLICFTTICLLLLGTACNGGGKSDPNPKPQPIDISEMGVNNFFVDSQFGTIDQQYADIEDNLGLHYVRVLFAWSDQVQPTPTSPLDYSFYDNILAGIPAGVDVLIILVHTPAWMSDSANWVDGDARKTFVEKWVTPTVQRYANNTGVVGWEVFNEPNAITVPSDNSLGLNDPANYVSLLQMSAEVIRATDPTSLIVVAATTSIQQNYPHSLDYNKAIQKLGAEELVDIWNIHYYGTEYNHVTRKNGVADFLNSLTKPIWMTESGAQGAQQLTYVETTWPFLQDEVPAIERIYYYQYANPGDSAGNYGMLTTDPVTPESDLYIYLENQPK